MKSVSVTEDELIEARKQAEFWRRKAAALREALEPANGEIAVSVIKNNPFPWETNEKT